MNFMPSCEEVRENLTEYMEGKLPIHKRMGIRLHLLMCAACDGLLHALKALPKFSKGILAPPPEAPQEARAVFLDTLKRLREGKPH